MPRTIVLLAFALVGAFTVIMGFVAIIDPVRFVKLQGRANMGEYLPWSMRRWYDLDEIARSREVRLQYRLVGIGFICLGGMFVVLSIRQAFGP